MRPLAIAVPALVFLVACVTPRQACESQATGELRTIDALIAETQGNLARGYGLEQSQEVRSRRELCDGRREDGTTFRYFCDRTDVVDVERPVALDLRAEQAKLDSLLDRRALLQDGVAARLQACQALPDEI